MKKARVLHRKALKPEDADILCGVWWPSWSTCNNLANETPWQQWRRQGCCTERLWNQRMQILYVEYDDQAEACATISSRPDNSHWISFFLPFRRNKVYASWQLDKASILVNRGSHFQVHFVWQVWDGQWSPAFKSIRLKAFGGWKFDRGTTKLHARILRGKGVQKKKPNMFTVGRSTSATFVLPVCVYIYILLWRSNTFLGGLFRGLLLPLNLDIVTLTLGNCNLKVWQL